MALNQMIVVLNKYDTFLQVLTHPIIEWRSRQRKLVFQKRIPFIWCFNVFVAFGLHSVTNVFLLLRKLNGCETLSPLPVLMVHIILLFLWCYNFAVGVGMMIHGEEYVSGWNLLLNEYTKLAGKGTYVFMSILEIQNYIEKSICTCTAIPDF